LARHRYRNGGLACSLPSHGSAWPPSSRCSCCPGWRPAACWTGPAPSATGPAARMRRLRRAVEPRPPVCRLGGGRRGRAGGPSAAADAVRAGAAARPAHPHRPARLAGQARVVADRHPLGCGSARSCGPVSPAWKARPGTPLSRDPTCSPPGLPPVQVSGEPDPNGDLEEHLGLPTSIPGGSCRDASDGSPADPHRRGSLRQRSRPTAPDGPCQSSSSTKTPGSRNTPEFMAP
jgi:hypothetical protein